MFKYAMKSDTIQFLLLVVTGLGMLTGFAGWCDARYAKETQLKKLSWEIHAIYLTIPSHQRQEIEKQRLEFEMKDGGGL